MQNVFRHSNLLRLILALAIVGIVIAPSVLIPFYLSTGAMPIDISSSGQKDDKYLAALHDAYLLERSGKLKDALTKYRLAADSSNTEIQETARQGEQRTYKKLAEIERFFPDYPSILAFSLQARAPLLAVLFMILAISFLSGFGKRRGVALRPFNVTPKDHTEAFNTMLADNITAIVRVYESDQLNSNC